MGDCDVIRLSLRRPKRCAWELTTSASSPSIAIPKIELVDHKGRILCVTQSMRMNENRPRRKRRKRSTLKEAMEEQQDKLETLDPRDSSDFVAKMSSNVFIDHRKIPEFAEHLYKALENRELRIVGVHEHETFPGGLSEKEEVNFIFVLDALNFCFWSKLTEERWTVRYEGKTYTGFYGLTASLSKAIHDGVKIYDPKVYANLTMDAVLKILRGENKRDINLAGHRLKCLQEAGNTLILKYNGDFTNCILTAEKSAEKLLKILTQFSCFNDTAVYYEKTISFHKKAQILVSHIWSLKYGKGISHFDDIDVITMSPDYRIPQVLVHFGLIKYSKKLLKKLKRFSVLPNGSIEEVEIRGCSVKVVELVMEHLKTLMEERKSSYDCNSIIIDKYLWSYRKKEEANLNHIPYHRTYSIHY